MSKSNIKIKTIIFPSFFAAVTKHNSIFKVISPNTLTFLITSFLISNYIIHAE